MLVCAGGLGHMMRCSFLVFLLPFFEPDLFALVFVFPRVFSRLSINFRTNKAWGKTNQDSRELFGG